MTLKYLPTTEDWERYVKAYKLKDNGLTNAFDEFWTKRDDELEKSLAVLPKIAKLATDEKKSKEVIAAPPAGKWLDEVIGVVPKVRKMLEDKKREFERTGMQTVDVQIILVDWNGKPISSDYVAYTKFSSPGARDINPTSKITSNGVDLDDLRLRPSGTLYLWVRLPSDIATYMEGTTDYEIKPGKSVMKFKAVQHSKTVKVKAKTLEEATEKIGVKGSLGLEFEVVKVGGEVTKESEFKRGFEQEVEWEVEYGFPTVKDFKQI
jgi:hypothetical protein